MNNPPIYQQLADERGDPLTRRPDVPAPRRPADDDHPEQPDAG